MPLIMAGIWLIKAHVFSTYPRKCSLRSMFRSTHMHSFITLSSLAAAHFKEIAFCLSHFVYRMGEQCVVHKHG